MTKQQFVLFRSLSSLIFIYAGIKHLVNPEGVFKRIVTGTVFNWLPNETLFMTTILISGMLMVIGGLFMLAGFQTRKSAIVLLAMIIPITLTTQLENLNDLGPFFKNVAIAGSLLLISKTKNYDSKKINSYPDLNGRPELILTNNGQS